MGIIHLLGITGVDQRERPLACVWAHRPGGALLPGAVGIPIEWYLEETGTVSLADARIFDWGIWLGFVVETALLSWLVRDKQRYLRTNWMNLVIIFGGVPLEWTYTPLLGAIRNLRLVIMIY